MEGGGRIVSDEEGAGEPLGRSGGAAVARALGSGGGGRASAGRMPTVASNDEVRSALIRALEAHGLRVRARARSAGGAAAGHEEAPPPPSAVPLPIADGDGEDEGGR